MASDGSTPTIGYTAVAGLKVMQWNKENCASFCFVFVLVVVFNTHTHTPHTSTVFGVLVGCVCGGCGVLYVLVLLVVLLVVVVVLLVVLV